MVSLVMALVVLASPDRAALVQGIESIAAPGSPGEVVTWNEKAFPVITDRDGTVVVGAYADRGRIVALAHNGYLATDDKPTQTFLTQAVKWAGKGAPGNVFVANNPKLLQVLRNAVLPTRSGTFDWRGVDQEVVVIDAHQVQAADVRPLQEFVRRGGGLVIAATGWGWQQGSRAPMWEFHANQALRPFGVGFGEGFADPDQGRRFGTAQVPSAADHAGGSLAQLANNKGDGRAALRLLRVLPSSDPWLKTQIAQLGESSPPAIGPKKPLPQKDGRARFLVAVRHQAIERGEFLQAEPSAMLFPGEPSKSARRVNETVRLRANETRWQGTGLYAAPGEPIDVTVPEELIARGARLRIGPHTDANWHHARWDRFPEVSMDWPLTAPTTRRISPFGGLIYIDLAQPLTSPLTIRIDNALASPRYVLGQTTAEEWQRVVQSSGSPWAEIESDHLVVTVPTVDARNVADPKPLAEFWDRIADSAADLATTPRWRGFKERFVADAQISAGYMHSGYPIKTHLDVTDLVTNLATLRKEGSWGHFHELGHNHQSGDWTFDGTVEVTVNLFTLYAYDRVVGSRPADRVFDAKQSLAAYRQFVKNGKSFARWSDEPFTALAMYAQVQNAFGWDAFKRVFAEYRQLPGSARPRSEQEKRDQWMVRLSRTVGRDLGAFFEAWSVPTTPAARESIAALPDWMPEGME